MTGNQQRGAGRRFLFLQGPHGPFFGRLARAMTRTGAAVQRVGFTGADRVFWPRDLRYRHYRGRPEDLAACLSRLVVEDGITDVALYGDGRPVHRAAADAARKTGATLHVFEEGYLRPYWITYERGGANGRSPLIAIPTSAILRLYDRGPMLSVETPVRWGELRQHIAWSAASHALAWAGPAPTIPPHRGIPLRREARLALRKLARVPFDAVRRDYLTRRMLADSAPYVIVPLQLDHDASFREWSGFASTGAFAETVIAAFARSAPSHVQLVFKDHPLEDGRAAHGETIRRVARATGLSTRVHHLPGGKLSRLLDRASAVVTANSTAGQQALWRGLPLMVLGTAIYGRPGLTSSQDLDDFLSAPVPPDPHHYRTFRQFLLETSQIPGGYYSRAGRAQTVRRLVDAMLDPLDPYERRLSANAALPQHIGPGQPARQTEAGANPGIPIL